MRTTLILSSVGGIAALAAIRDWLEQDPVLHILVLLPGLALFGWAAAEGLGARKVKMRPANAAAGTLVAVFTILFWMLPRYIDASLVHPSIAISKFISIPILVGGALAVSWHATHVFLRGFLKANAISMLGILAFLYTHAPIRICNSYLVSDQERLGLGFLLVALALAVAWTVPLFFSVDDAPSETGHPFREVAT